MFDPTIFENLKVGIENYVYDLDNIDQDIIVTNRQDLLDLAVMSRTFSLFFSLTESNEVTAEICIEASTKDLSDEILEKQDQEIGSKLIIRFYMEIDTPEQTCPIIEDVCQSIWGFELVPVQTINYQYGEDTQNWKNKIEISFPRKINEDQMNDIPNLIDHMLQSLVELNRL